MHIDVFKKIAKQVTELEKTGVKFDVNIAGDASWQKGFDKAWFEPTHYEYSTLKQLAEIQTIVGKPIGINNDNCKIKLAGVKTNSCVAEAKKKWDLFKKNPAERQKLPTLKYYSDIAYKGRYGNEPDLMIIAEDPPEQLEDEVTYRYIGTTEECQFCIPHTHQLYNYLDKGFVYMVINLPNGKEKVFIANELNVDTYLCFQMLEMQPIAFGKFLQHECFMSSRLATVNRVRMEKALQETSVHQFNNYTRIRDEVLKDYEKTANAGLIDKLIKGTIPAGSFNEIKLTKTSAQYEALKIEAPDFMETMHGSIVFDDRTDIHLLVRTYIRVAIGRVEDHEWAKPTAVWTDAKENEALTEVELAANELYKEQLNADQTVEAEFQINGFNIKFSRSKKNSRRYINDILINKAEIEEVCYNALCCKTQEEYDKFVTSVKNMSLKWHKAIANGLCVKIHDTMTADEYKKAAPIISAPKLNFRVIDDQIHLVVDKDRAVKIKFNEVLNKVSALNRKTNDLGIEGTYVRRNARWARNELTKILKICCTFEEKELITQDVVIKGEEGEEDTVEKQPVLDANGKKTYKKTKTCLLSDADAAMIERMAREYQEKAIEREKLFLELAVKNTKAIIERISGEDYYVVEGTKVKNDGTVNKYAVNAKTNEVSHYGTMRHICIVEEGHVVRTGGDATAARLYALRHDQKTVEQIGTLRH